MKTRQNHRNGTTGRYLKNPCECGCGKGAPIGDYYSDDRVNSTGFGLVLRKACADKLASLSDEAYLAHFTALSK